MTRQELLSHVATVKSHAAEIAADWRAGRMSVRHLAVRERSDQATIRAILHSQIPDAEYRRIVREHRHKYYRPEVPRLAVKVFKRRSGKRNAKGYRTTIRNRFIKIGTRQWIPLSRYLWEKAHGRPVPPGHVVAHLDGDTMNDDLSNLVLRTRAEQTRHTARVCDHARRGEKIGKTRREQAAIAKRIRETMAQRAAAGPAEPDWEEWDDDEEAA